MCSYREKKSEPQEMLQLDGYTVDYIEPIPDLEEGRFFFNAVKEGDSVVFACDDENESHLWVMALYRATGQAHKPTPLMQTLGNKNSTISRLQGDKQYITPIGPVSMEWTSTSYLTHVDLVTTSCFVYYNEKPLCLG
ncbi:unnamed protein product [Oppiella nova]|uniref:PH domain-containing protein n=1 Tax=Oppiella nova TaxID=334625 RepID=A0A7R9MRZ1_9ACAR|nr:unnamed protein product [Oppiella nova]CAG2182249.1 unnamed protein product [Oppiella nova]